MNHVRANLLLKGALCTEWKVTHTHTRWPVAGSSGSESQRSSLGVSYVEHDRHRLVEHCCIAGICSAHPLFSFYLPFSVHILSSLSPAFSPTSLFLSILYLPPSPLHLLLSSKPYPFLLSLPLFLTSYLFSHFSTSLPPSCPLHLLSFLTCFPSLSFLSILFSSFPVSIFFLYLLSVFLITLFSCLFLISTSLRCPPLSSSVLPSPFTLALCPPPLHFYFLHSILASFGSPYIYIYINNEQRNVRSVLRDDQIPQG